MKYFLSYFWLILEILVIALLFCFITSKIEPIDSTYDFIERAIIGITIYEIIIYVFLGIINDVELDSYVALIAFTEVVLLFFETKDEIILREILRKYEIQLKSSIFNSKEIKKEYQNIKLFLDKGEVNLIRYNLISYKLAKEMTQFKWKHSLLLRKLK